MTRPTKLIEFTALINDKEHIRKAFGANHRKKYGWVANCSIHSHTHGDQRYVKVDDNPRLEIFRVDDDNITVLGKERYFLTRVEGDTNNKHPKFEGICGDHMAIVQLSPMKAELRY